jgi:hypothetical protein
LVALVTRLVKVLRLPITLLEKVCTPVTIEAAMSAPGRVTRPPWLVGAAVRGAEPSEAGRKVGS